MPWKGEKNPYKIWISEIILQQTRVKQGLLYYNKFIEQFPTLSSLAFAADESVFKVWEGLGYYTRCKNLLFTAQFIHDKLNDAFPSTYEDILALKGIGPYTAAAISSFAYGLPHAVVDGNVFRVLARFFGEAIPIDSVKGKSFFSALANELLFTKDSALYNQAIMDFGATVCKPQIPECNQCILQKNCTAFSLGLVNKLPVKEKRLVRKERCFTYFVFEVEDEILIRKRIEKDIWENLYEFYLFETNTEWNLKLPEIKDFLYKQLGIANFRVTRISKIFTQQLTHQNLQGRFISIHLTEIPQSLQHYKAVKAESLSLIAFPKFINQYLQSDHVL